MHFIFLQTNKTVSLKQEFIIRKAIDDDLSSIDDIYNQAILEKSTAHVKPLAPEERRQWFSEHQHEMFPVLVAERDGMIIGWLSISPYRKGRMALHHTAEISYYVHSEYRNKGIGSTLLTKSIDNSKQLGYRVLIAIILEHNTPSIKLLKRFGFEQWGFLPEVADFDGLRFGQYYYGLLLY